MLKDKTRHLFRS